MVFTTAQRAAIAENDPAWLLQFQIRAALTVLSLIALGCLGSVIADQSNFQSPAYQLDSKVWPLLLLIVLSLVWNVITVAVYTKWKRPLNPLIQLLVHGILTLLFIIIGGVATHDAALASSIIRDDPYSPAPGTDSNQANYIRTIQADNGSTITIDTRNTKECPAFASCPAQAAWMQGTQHRAGVALAGCAIFFLCLPVHLLLTLLYIRDFRIRRSSASPIHPDNFQLNTTPPVSQAVKHPYARVQDDPTTSQVHLLREGRGGLGFHKPNSATDSVISVSTIAQVRPSTALTTRSRPRFVRPKSNGPALPLAFPLSRTISMASTIASRRKKSNASTIASRRRKSADTSKDLPPVPMINTTHLPVSNVSYSPRTPDTAILSPHSATSPPTPSTKAERPLIKRKEVEKSSGATSTANVSPSQLGKTAPPEISLSPVETRPQSPTIAQSLATSEMPVQAADTPLKPTKVYSTTPKVSAEYLHPDRPLSPIADPFSLAPYDDHDPELSALPAIPIEALPRLSSQTSRPSSPRGGFGDMDMLRSLRSTLFASDTDGGRRSSFGSGSNGRVSPFGRSHSPISFASGKGGRASPWKERQERKELEKELERERAEREKELMEAQQKAYRAAEKMESAYLREEMSRQDEKAALRQKKVEERIAKLKNALEELKNEQDLEEQRAEERAEKERQEEAEFQAEMARYGEVVAERVVQHQRAKSTAKSVEARPGTSDTTATKGKQPETYGFSRDKALPLPPPMPEESPEEEGRQRFSWETGHTTRRKDEDTPG